jgi:hypothetical protein
MSIFSRIFQKEDGAEDPPADAAPIAVVPPEPTQETAAPAFAPAEAVPPAAAGAEKSNQSNPALRTVDSPPPPPLPPRRAAAEVAAANDPVAPARSVPPPVPSARRSPQARHKTPTPGRVTAVVEKSELSERIETLQRGGEKSATTSSSGRHAVYSVADQAAVRATFEDLAVVHVRPLRNMMLDLKWGEPVAVWLDLARPALKSLRQMAEQVELKDLVQAIDGFSAALDRAVQGGAAAGSTEQAREALLEAYAPLAKAMPRAFELEGERDRREPIIVQSILRQVSALEPLMMQRLYAVGLGRLETLLRATAEEIAVVADLQPAVAAAVVAKVQELRRGAESAADLSNARRAVQPLVRGLQSSQQAYEKAAAGWSHEAVVAKRRHRREREQTFLQIKVALTRAGEVDLVQRMDSLPFARRIDELERYLREPPASATATA